MSTSPISSNADRRKIAIPCQKKLRPTNLIWLAKFSNAHGRIFDLNEQVIVPLYHPAAALRATAMLNDLRADFKKLPDIVSGKIIVELPKIEMKRKKTAPPQTKLF